LDASGEQAAKDQTIAWPVVPTVGAGNVTPATTGPTPTDQTIAPGSMTISKSRSVVFGWNGEEQKSLGGIYNMILVDQFSQSMRTLVNEVEADLAALYIYASRAYGTAGTAPFDSSGKIYFSPDSKILQDNGAQPRPAVCSQYYGWAALRTLIELWRTLPAVPICYVGCALGSRMSFAIRERTGEDIHLVERPELWSISRPVMQRFDHPCRNDNRDLVSW
jgi:hypothetical protein